MKASVGLDKSRFVDLEEVSRLVSKPEDMEFAQRISDQAVTLVRDKSMMLPLRRTEASSLNTGVSGVNSQAKHGLVAVVLGEALTSNDGREFKKALKLRCPDADVLYFHNRAGNAAGLEVLRAAKEADELVIVVYMVHTGVRQIMVNGKLKTAFGPMGPSGRLLEDLLEVAPEKTVVVALGSPYLIEGFPRIRTYICTYAMATSSEISAVKALFGEIQNHAKLPVTLPGIGPRGFSLPWPQKETSPESAHAVH